uniref:No apical meristem-associated C-terminal domain-containing protein n=1 Tax=Hordeum vulgare subsp. vulgare TaxID=112509 RepID=A0A8I6XV38_HORVV
MDAHTGAPLTPLYSRETPAAAAAAAAENPSAASVGAGAAAATGAPPTVGLARSLFLPPQMTTPTGGVAPAPSRAAAAPSKLPNASELKKGKTSAKKKAADGSGSSKAKKKLAGRRTGAASTEVPMSSLVEPAADAHHVFDEMLPSLNDDAYMSTMGVGSNNSRWSQTNDIHLDDHEFEVDEEVLKDDEKWKKREDLDDLHLSNKRKRTIELNDYEEEDDASSDDGKRSPTPNSVSYSKPKRPDGCKKDKTEKKKRKGDDELTNAMEAIVKARKEANEVRKMARNQDAAAEERRLAAEERRVATEERKVALEERKVGMEERAKLLEWEKHLFFLDTSLFNDAQKEYVNLAREEVLIQKRAMIRGGLGGMGGGGLGAMGGMGLGAMGGLGGFGAMGGMGAPPAAMGGMGGFGAPSNAMEGMGGMSFASLMGGMGVPPVAMGGMGAPPAMGGMSFDVPHTHTHKNAVEELAKTVGATRDAVRDEVREEDSSSKAEESSAEEEEEEEEDEEDG